TPAPASAATTPSCSSSTCSTPADPSKRPSFSRTRGSAGEHPAHRAFGVFAACRAGSSPREVHTRVHHARPAVDPRLRASVLWTLVYRQWGGVSRSLPAEHGLLARQLVLPHDPDRAGHAVGPVVAVPARVLVQVLLVVALGVVERTGLGR